MNANFGENYFGPSTFHHPVQQSSVDEVPHSSFVGQKQSDQASGISSANVTSPQPNFTISNNNFFLTQPPPIQLMQPPTNIFQPQLYTQPYFFNGQYVPMPTIHAPIPIPMIDQQMSQPQYFPTSAGPSLSGNYGNTNNTTNYMGVHGQNNDFHQAMSQLEQPNFMPLPTNSTHANLNQMLTANMAQIQQTTAQLNQLTASAQQYSSQLFPSQQLYSQQQQQPFLVQPQSFLPLPKGNVAIAQLKQALETPKIWMTEQAIDKVMVK